MQNMSIHQHDISSSLQNKDLEQSELQNFQQQNEQQNILIILLQQKIIQLENQYQQLLNKTNTLNATQKSKQMQVSCQKKQITSKTLSIKIQPQPKQPQTHQNQQQNHSSSGQIQNLMIIDTQQSSKKQTIQTQKQKQFILSNINIVPTLFVHQTSIIHKKEINSQVGVLKRSKGNLQMLEESEFQLSLAQLRKISQLKQFGQISFKEKHYPNVRSTASELLTYGKRLCLLLQIPYASQSMQYSITSNSILYYFVQHLEFILICYFNHSIYLGEYQTLGQQKQVKKSGYGILYRQGKYFYQGNWINDRKQGFGLIFWINKFIGYGNFIQGFMDGKGLMVGIAKQQYKDNSKQEVYLGQFKLGMKDGKGRLTYDTLEQAYYEGEFYDGKKHGIGYEKFLNQDTYYGHYFNDKFQGQGQYTWKNETIYKGTFKQGLKHGQGVLIYTNGKQLRKLYDLNKQVNQDSFDDKKTIKSSRMSSLSINKSEQKTFIQKNSRYGKSYSRSNLQSNISQSSKTPIQFKNSKQRKRLSQLLREKQLKADLQNLNQLLKPQKSQQSQLSQTKSTFLIRKRFSSMQRLNVKSIQCQSNQNEINKLRRNKPKINQFVLFQEDTKKHQGVRQANMFEKF